MIERRKNIARRKLLQYGTAAIGSYAVLTSMGNKINAAESTDKLVASAGNKKFSNLSPDQAISELVQGNQRFIRQRSRNPNQSRLRLLETSDSQSPFACILTCSDSRVPPEIIFDRGLGDLFVVRDAGNIATSGEIGSLEYGALVLGAKAVVVMGHQNCGAVKAAIELGSTSGFIGSIINEILPAIQISRSKEGDLVYNAIIANIQLQKQKVQTSPVISKLTKENKIKVVGAYYNLENGRVEILE
ncbi:MAG: carbonic anhydrase [Prochloraceae cyanobacterium]|nr:carbonic anhydrase [Prochloraceae cyanobacterium]